MKHKEIVNFESLLQTVSRLPLVRIDRNEFLEKELKKHCSEQQVIQAIERNPAYAGIDIEIINEIADKCINFETNKVSAISFTTGLPGGIAMAAAIPADLTQNFAHMLRILQKLIYLYGWNELTDNVENMDDETTNLITLFVGIMYGVNQAASTITKISASAAEKAAKGITTRALTKGSIYPIVKKISGVLGIKMTKDIFAKNVSKVIPVIGGVASGGITYITFKPMAYKLKKHLSTLKFADVNYYKSAKYTNVNNCESTDNNCESTEYIAVDYTDV